MAKGKSATAEPPVATSAIDAAIAADSEQAARDEADRREAEDTAYRCYAEILKRDVLGRPKPSDAEQVRSLITRLSISRDQLVADRKLVQEAMELVKLHADRGARQSRMVQAREKFRAMEKRHEQEHHETWHALSQAEADLSVAGSAGYELDKLRRQRPQLFDDDAVPPRLRGD